MPEELAAAVLLDALSLPPQGGVATAADLVTAVVGMPRGSGDHRRLDHDGARERPWCTRVAVRGRVRGARTPPTWQASAARSSPRARRYALYRVVERLAVVVGQIDWTVPRDEGYLFLSLGRSLERLDMMARVLAVRHDQLWPEGGPVATLRSAAALNAFLRTQHPMTGDEVRRFLLLDGASRVPCA